MARHGELLTFSLTLNVSEMLPGRKGLSCLTGFKRGLCCSLGYRGGKNGSSTEGRLIVGQKKKKKRGGGNKGEKLLNNQQWIQNACRKYLMQKSVLESF